MKRKIVCALKKMLSFFLLILIFFAVLLKTSITWLLSLWGNLSMDEVVYHLKAPLQGTNTGMIENYFSSCLAEALLAVLMFVLLFLGIRKYVHTSRILKGATFFLAIILIVESVYTFWDQMDVEAYASNSKTYSTFIDDNYVDPANVELAFPEKKRNLIYIYLESMENTYSDKKNGGDFPEDIIPELTELSEENENFSGDDTALNGGVPMPGATWTMGAMFAQSSGLPLNIPIDGNEMSSRGSFFPQLTTLGDILDEAGYEQIFMIGSDATFGGRKLYFQTHGNYDIHDYYYAREQKEIPSDYYEWWGYEDDKLFAFAKQELTELAKQGNPFNYTMLTVDTHPEDGYVCADCADQYGDNQYANVIACSSKKVTEFVRWIQKQDFYQDTTIVLSGDHLTMDTDFCDNVDTNYNRKVYTTYINAAVEKKSTIYREYSTFDNFPTTLASLGVTIEGDKLGLGTNLFSINPTLLEKHGNKTFAAEIQKKSKLMDSFTSDIKAETKEANTSDENKSESPIELTVGDNGVYLVDTANPNAFIEETGYDYETGIFGVQLGGMEDSEGIQNVAFGVWTKENQADMMWYAGAMSDDGGYQAEIYAPDFAYYQGLYYIQAYYTDQDGNPVLAAEGQMEVQ